MSYTYIVSYATSSTGPWTQAGTSSVASFTINNLSVGTNYWVQVIAVDSISGLQSSPSVAGPFQTGSVTQESSSGTSVTSSAQTIYSSQTPGQPAPSGGPFDTWTLTGQGGQVVHNGTADGTTSSVLQLFYTSHTVYHEESSGNSFGTPGWWQWTGTTTYPSATPGSGSFTDTKGNTWALNGSGNPVINTTVVDTVSHAQKIYLISGTVWQIDQTNNWYSFTPTGTITSTAQLSWAGPTTTSPITGWAACASPSGVPLTITGISLSNNTVSNTAPSGTTVGAVTVSLSSGTFSGSLSLSGANASSFSVSGSNLITNAGSLTAGNYSISLTATQSTASNSPVTSPFTIISQASVGGPGPAASSNFITADFSAAMQWPVSGGGQQAVSQRLYGLSSSSLSNVRYGSNFGAWAQSAVTNQLGVINPGLVYLKNGGITYWDANQNVVPSSLTNLVNNVYKIDPLGILGIIIGVDFNLNVSGDSSNEAAWVTPAQYGTAMARLATYLLGYTMPNGKKFPLIGMMGNDEPDNHTESLVVSYYNQFGPAVHNVNSSLLIVGPNLSSIGWTDFPTQVSSLDVFSWDTFTGLDSGSERDGLNASILTNQSTRYTSDANIGSRNVTRKPSAMMIGGYGTLGGAPNFDSLAAENSYLGAVYCAQRMIQSLNNANVPLYGGLWGGWDNGEYGAITSDEPNAQGYPWYGYDGTTKITPKGYWMAKAVRSTFGTRWNVPTNSAGFLTLACSPSSGHFGLMVVNAGQGARSGTVALSHWPVNTSGNATANVWQMNSSIPLPGTDGIVSTVQVTNGVTSTLSFPDPSVTIISI